MNIEDNNTFLLRRHKIKLFLILCKVFLMVFLMVFSFYIFWKFHIFDQSSENMNFISVIFIVLIVNLIYLIFIFDIVAYFNNIIIINDTNLVILQNWLFIRENIEIIDLNQITKLNIECQWIIPNLLWYWRLIIEQQKGENRPLFFISEPHVILNHLRKKIDKINDFNRIREDNNLIEW